MALIPRTPVPRLLGLGLHAWFRLGLLGCAAALLVLNWNIRRLPPDAGGAVPAGGAEGELEIVTLDALPEPATDRPGEPGEPGEPSLVNDGWYVRNMATAHGAFVIEVEAEDPEESETISRALIEPIKDDYAEILVYVNRMGDDSDLPARRVQWTPRDGYVELSYDRPETGR